MPPVEFEVTEGPVFYALEDSVADAISLTIRSELMFHIEQIIHRRRLTQAAAAKLFGVTQPRISDLTRGQIHRFSIDALVTMLGRAGAKVDVSVGPAR